MKGKAHPINSLISEIIEFFSEYGYSVATGPELEGDYYNFEALNIPKGHPAREMWDTFWIKNVPGLLLRTHTSSVQVRHMEKHKPPIRIIAPGKVFRNEATDTTHEAQFFQIEGLCITEDTSLADLRGMLEEFAKYIFGSGVLLRYRPSFFPFTEPSLEVDMKRSGDDKWIEVLGCGMVHPMLLSRVGIDSNKYQGFAFGIGLDRILMLRYNFDDIRTLYKGDMRFIDQF